MSQTKSIVDVATTKSMMTKTYEEEYELMEKLASNHHQMVFERTIRKPMSEVLQMDAFTTIFEQIVVLAKQVQSLEN